MTDDVVINAHNLTKVYNGFTAVDHIDLSVKKQECFGLLGPNGAGKTTTVKMISCFIEPTEGSLEVLGMPVRSHFRQIKAHVGVAHQENNLDPDLNVWDNLRVYARYFDIDRNVAAARSEELLSFIGMTGKKKSHIDELSGGMKRRLILARSLLNKPDLLILDEPTTGLDPQARHYVWELIRRLKSEGTTVLLTTHYMDEAAHLCDRLLIMDHGKVLTEGRPADLVKQHVGSNIVEIDSVEEETEQYLRQKRLPYEKTAHRILVSLTGGDEAFSRISGDLCRAGCTLRMANLEDVFLKLTGRDLLE